MSIYKIYSGICTIFIIIITALFLLSNTWMSRLIQETKTNSVVIDDLKEQKELLEDSLSVYKEAFKSLSKERNSLQWLTRVMYAETDNPLEAWYVGWSVRNRVEKCYRGECTYRGVIMDPYQFSSFNPGYPYRQFYLSLGRDTTTARWKQFKNIAKLILSSDRSLAPFDKDALHFYSEISMVGRNRPLWAVNKDHIDLPLVNDYRFRFFNNIDTLKYE